MDRTFFLGGTTNGYITVYLTLTMTVLLSLCLTLIEGTRSNAIKLESKIVSDIATNSILAEYNRELLTQYNLFAIEDSYGTDNASLDNVENHLWGYLNHNFETEDIFLSTFLYRDYLGLSVADASIEGVRYFTDQGGEVFRKRAYEAVKDEIGISTVTEITELVQRIESGNLMDMNLTERMENVQNRLVDSQKEAAKKKEVETNIVNPAGEITTTINSGMLYSFINDAWNVSTNTINSDDYVSKRYVRKEINEGNLSISDEPLYEELLERIAFQEYLFEYMGHYGEERDGDVLKYQIEYILEGQNSDVRNLEMVVGTIFSIRFAADYLYIISDEEMKTEAEAMAEVIAFFTYTTELADLWKELILLVWSCYEAMHDVKSMLAGNRIVFMKDKDTWFTSLTNFEGYNTRSTKGDDTGLLYTDYLRAFLSMMDSQLLNYRAMDIVEMDIRNVSGNEKFRIDACIDCLQFNIQTYSSFGYTNEFIIRKKYE